MISEDEKQSIKMRRRFSILVAATVLATCCDALTMGALRASPTLGHDVRATNVMRATNVRCAEKSPEEMLLDAIGCLKDNNIEDARRLVSDARSLCDGNGGPTSEQTALLDLLTSRLPPPKAKQAEPTLAEMFPGTTAAPTGRSLILPGTPSFAELPANAKKKKEAKDAAARQAREQE